MWFSSENVAVDIRKRLANVWKVKGAELRYEDSATTKGAPSPYLSRPTPYLNKRQLAVYLDREVSHVLL